MFPFLPGKILVTFSTLLDILDNPILGTHLPLHHRAVSIPSACPEWSEQYGMVVC